MKAMILAAGRGERLRPLTDETPKPLLKLAGAPLIAHHIQRLAAAGFKEIVINVSYLAKKITQYLGDGSQWGVNLEFSYEPTALESGGGIVQALPLLGTKPFLVVSADIYTDYPFATLNKPLEGLAHLVLAPNPNFSPDFHLDNGKITREGQPKYTYGNIGVYHPALFANQTPHLFPLREVLFPAVDANRVSGELYKGIWENITSVQQYETLKKQYEKTSFN